MYNVYAPHALAVSVIILVAVHRWRKHKLPYPPGPKGYPIIGNVLDVPRGVPAWEGFTSMAHKYGAYQSNNTNCQRVGLTVRRNGYFAVEDVQHEHRHSEQRCGHLERDRKEIRYLFGQSESQNGHNVVKTR